jgi:GNAT superfamily N-acetyltransferase
MADWRHLLKRDGWKSILSPILKDIVTLPCRRIKYVVLTLDLSKDLPELEAAQDIEIRHFQSSDLSFVHEEFLPSEANLCRRRLQAGHIGFVAVHQGRPVAYSWLCGDIGLERVKIDLSPGDILATDSFTSPDFRKQGFQSAIASAKIRYACEAGYDRVIAYIEEDNGPSRFIWEQKLGSELKGYLVFQRVGLRRHTRYREIK